MQKHLGESTLNSLRNVAEAGAGWGETTGALAAELTEAKFCTYELDSESVKSMREKGIDAHFGMLEEELQEPAVFDLIMSSHVVEHMREPRAVLEKYHHLLKPKGYLFTEIPLENPVPNWWGRDPSEPYWVGHLHFFGRGHFERMLESIGYEIVGKSAHDHVMCAGCVMPGSETLYNVMDVAPALDTTESTAEFPRLLRVLARKKG